MLRNRPGRCSGSEVPKAAPLPLGSLQEDKPLMGWAGLGWVAQSQDTCRVSTEPHPSWLSPGSAPLTFQDGTALALSCIADYGAPVFPFLAVGGYDGKLGQPGIWEGESDRGDGSRGCGKGGPLGSVGALALYLGTQVSS